MITRLFHQIGGHKGQIKSDWRAVDSPKKRTNEFVLFFAVKSKKSKKEKKIVLGENLWCANLLTVLSDIKY